MVSRDAGPASSCARGPYGWCPVSTSLLVQAVLRCLADHPHDSTAVLVSARLGDIGDVDAVEAALTLLLADVLVAEASGHYVLTAAGWRRHRADG